MNLKYKAAVLIAGLTMGVTPALAAAHSAHPAKSGTTSTNAKKYGKYCQGESKQHVKGMKGTPFSQCVNAAAHLVKGTSSTAKRAYKAESKKHVTGMKNTPFSVCVKAANAARKAAHSGSTTSGS